MNAARIIETMGVSVSLVDGKVRLVGLDRLDKETATRVLEVARTRKAEIVEELARDGGQAAFHTRERLAKVGQRPALNVSHSGPVSTEDTKSTPSRARGEAVPVPADATPLEALARFERDPRGVISWLAQQEQGQPAQQLQRWAAVIRAEARQRMAEVAE